MSARSTLSRLFACLDVFAGACECAVVHPSVKRLFLWCWLTEAAGKSWSHLFFNDSLPCPFPTGTSWPSWLKLELPERESSRNALSSCGEDTHWYPVKSGQYQKFTQGRWLALPNQVSESEGTSQEEDWVCKKAQTSHSNVIKKKENENKFFI